MNQNQLNYPLSSQIWVKGSYTPNTLGFDGNWTWKKNPSSILSIYSQSSLTYGAGNIIDCNDFLPNTIVEFDSFVSKTQEYGSCVNGPFPSTKGRYMCAMLTLSRNNDPTEHQRVQIAFVYYNDIIKSIYTRRSENGKMKLPWYDANGNIDTYQDYSETYSSTVSVYNRVSEGTYLWEKTP